MKADHGGREGGAAAVECPACKGQGGEWVLIEDGFHDSCDVFKECLPCKGFGMVTRDEADELNQEIGKA